MRAILAGLVAGLLVMVVLAIGVGVSAGGGTGGSSTAGRVHTDAEVLCGACNG
jgi:hypothetical protein